MDLEDIAGGHMDKENAIKLFNDKKVRVLWNEEEEKWYFSIVEFVTV